MSMYNFLFSLKIQLKLPRIADQLQVVLNTITLSLGRKITLWVFLKKISSCHHHSREPDYIKTLKVQKKNLLPSESGSSNGFNSVTSGSPNGFKSTVAKSFSASSKKLSLLISSENKHMC